MERSIESDGLRVTVQTVTVERNSEMSDATPEVLAKIQDCLAVCRTNIAAALRGHMNLCADDPVH
jgi:hypothetical protein